MSESERDQRLRSELEAMRQLDVARTELEAQRDETAAASETWAALKSEAENQVIQAWYEAKLAVANVEDLRFSRR